MISVNDFKGLNDNEIIEAAIASRDADGIIDTATEEQIHSGTIILGASEYGEHSKDSLSNITISNVICKSRKSIIVSEYLKDTVISNVINKNPDTEPICVLKADGIHNIKTENIITAKN